MKPAPPVTREVRWLGGIGHALRMRGGRHSGRGWDWCDGTRAVVVGIQVQVYPGVCNGVFWCHPELRNWGSGTSVALFRPQDGNCASLFVRGRAGLRAASGGLRPSVAWQEHTIYLGPEGL